MHSIELRINSTSNYVFWKWLLDIGNSITKRTRTLINTVIIPRYYNNHIIISILSLQFASLQYWIRNAQKCVIFRFINIFENINFRLIVEDNLTIASFNILHYVLTCIIYLYYGNLSRCYIKPTYRYYTQH